MVKMTDTVYIQNGSIITSDRIIKRGSILIYGGVIKSVRKKGKPPKGSRIIDAKGSFVSPGFIDTHIHGSPGKIFLNEIKRGTTSILVALSCDDLTWIYEKVDAIRDFMRSDSLGANVLGVRLEGPYISARKCGAQGTRFIRKPDGRELAAIIKRCGPALKMMTIAPEIAGAIPLVRTLKSHHIIASLGHSDATYKEALAGIDAGVTHATHLFNAMRGIGRRSPGAVAAILSDKRVTAEVIADMIHVNSARFILTAAVKGLTNIIMVTDSIAADPPKGAWKEGGVYWLREGVKAGSALTMIGAVENAVTAARLSLVDAVRFATLNPARLLGVEGRKGSIAVGKDADLVMFDRSFKVKMTIVRGKIIYSR